MSEELKDNLTSGATWGRLLYMILFALVFNIAELVLGLVAIVQFLFRLITGAPDERLRQFGVSLGAYLRQIVLFQTFASEDRPFPFAPWPEADDFAGHGQVASLPRAD